MGDLVTCKCVLVKRDSGDTLYLVVPPCFNLRMIPCVTKGSKNGDCDSLPASRPAWEYEEKDGKLHLAPSLLATDTGFHTDYNWSCDYEVCPEGSEGYEYFNSLNPGLMA